MIDYHTMIIILLTGRRNATAHNVLSTTISPNAMHKATMPKCLLDKMII